MGVENWNCNTPVTTWIIAAAVRIARGSATVAMLSTAGIVAPLAGHRPGNPAYPVMVIGAGGNTPWYNDGGFWIATEIGASHGVKHGGPW